MVVEYDVHENSIRILMRIIGIEPVRLVALRCFTWLDQNNVYSSEVCL
jgi:hypothetical protein